MVTKTKKTETAKPQSVEEEQYPLFKAARKVLLAGIGAIALAQDEIEEFVARLVERGEIAEKDGRKLLEEIMDKRSKNVKRAEEEFNKHFEKFMTHMNIPRKSDLDALSAKIAALSKQVDEIKK